MFITYANFRVSFLEEIRLITIFYICKHSRKVLVCLKAPSRFIPYTPPAFIFTKAHSFAISFSALYILIYEAGSCLDLLKWKIFHHEQSTGYQLNIKNSSKSKSLVYYPVLMRIKLRFSRYCFLRLSPGPVPRCGQTFKYTIERLSLLLAQFNQHTARIFRV